MSWFRNASIKIKFASILGMSILVMLLMASAINVINSTLTSKKTMVDGVRTLAEFSELSLMPALLNNQSKDVIEILNSLRAHNDVLYAAIYKDREQKPLAYYSREKFDNYSLNVPNPINGKCVEGYFTWELLYYCKPLKIQDQLYGRMFFILELQNYYQQIFIQSGLVFLSLLIIAFFIFFCALKFVVRLTSPIVELASVYDKISQTGDYSLKATVTANDEIGYLANAFNLMLEKTQLWNDKLKEQREHLEDQLKERLDDLEMSKNNALKIANEAQMASHAKSEFLSLISHEIRTPLNAIIGFTEMLSETHLKEKQKEYLQLINQSGKSLLALITDILDFSDIEAGRIESDEHIFDCFTLINDLLSMSREIVKNKSIYVSHDTDSELPRYLLGDESRIRRILVNLLSNSGKFTEEGAILIRTYLEEISDVSYLCFEIEDTGIGIAEDRIKLLFQPFTQLESSDSRKHGGVGLGLALVNKLVDFLGGYISIYSVENIGTRFVVKLPITKNIESKESKQIPIHIAVFDDRYNSKVQNKLKTLQYHADVFDWSQSSKLINQPKKLKSYQLFIFNAVRYREAFEYVEKLKKIGFEQHNKRVAVFSNDGNFPLELTENNEKIATIKNWDDTLIFLEQLEQLLDGVNEQFIFESATNDTNQLRILIVEDNPVNSLMTAHILSQFGLKYDQAENGRVALQFFDKHQYDLILMDCQMPVMDGFQTTHEIRLIENITGQHVPIIALTANAFRENEAACFNAGMDGFLSKPFNKKQLFEILTTWLTLEKTLVSDDFQDQELFEETDAENVLDYELVNNLLELTEKNGNKFFNELKKTYHQTMVKLLNEIEIAIDALDYDSLRDCAHQLKSTNLQVGAKKFSEIAVQLEIFAREQNIERVTTIYSAMHKELQRVDKALSNL